MTAYIQKAIWMQVLIPLVVLTLYLVSLSHFLSWLVPEYPMSVNADFVNRAWKYSFLLAAGANVILLVLFRIGKGNKPVFENSAERLRVSDFILILLPLTPVVQYVLHNQDTLSPLGSLYILAVFVVFSVIFVMVLPILFGIVGSTKTLMILGLAFTFTITNMASLSAEFSWLLWGSLKIELLLFSAVFVVSWILYNLTGRKSLYLLVAAFFIANSAIQLPSVRWTETALPVTNNKLVELVGSRKPVSTPNIYLLIYDAYVGNETMLGYGIDNSAQEEYLETLGFRLYPHTYSIAVTTLPSMSRTLNASTELYGGARRAVSGDGITQNLLKSFGYETDGEFWTDYFFLGTDSSYDVVYPTGVSSPTKLLIKAIFMGAFRQDLVFDQPSYSQFAEHILGVFRSVPNKPRFVYMNTCFPGHSPQAGGGACRDNETQLFGERLNLANNEMKQDVESITQADPGAIVIVAGDHGPLLTKNCSSTGRDYDISEISRLDIQDRFGMFLAIRWPTTDFSEYDDITVLQDLFPAVFAYLFKDDKVLEAKVAPTTLTNEVMSGASVDNGIIHGGINDGEPLFVDQR